MSSSGPLRPNRPQRSRELDRSLCRRRPEQGAALALVRRLHISPDPAPKRRLHAVQGVGKQEASGREVLVDGTTRSVCAGIVLENVADKVHSKSNFPIAVSWDQSLRTLLYHVLLSLCSRKESG